MRIIGGLHRGLKLAEVGAGDAAAHLRPTSDRVRESIFNLLVNGGYGNPLAGANVLDLFAGTGALAVESLSRGAARATLVENGRTALALIARNLALARREGDARVIRADATRLTANPAPLHDLVFLDPPYGMGLGPLALQAAARGGWLAPGALVVWEENAPVTAPPGFDPLDQRRYGDTVVTLLQSPGG